MNVFDSGIQKTQKKHLKGSLFIGLIVLPAALLLTLWLAFSKGYNIEVKPQQARQAAIFDIAAGIGWFYEDKLYILGSEAAFTTTSTGYIAHTEVLNKASEPSIEIVLKPKPGLVFASTVPEVAEISWFVDGQLVAVDKSLWAKVTPGKHRIALDSPYHERLSKSFDIGKGEQKRWKFDLTPVQGQITINSRPQGASVLLNGNVVGNTPLNISREGEQYQLLISKPGYEDTEEVVALTNTSLLVERDYHLVAKKGFVSFALEPSGGQLLVNGRQVSDPARVGLAANQQHKILYQRSGYYSYQHDLSVEPGSEQNIPIKLKREFGQVILKATPDALVIVNGKPLGNSPQQVRLPAVSHKVEFKKPGYRSVVRTITPSGKNTTLIDEQLLTEYDARRKEGKPTEAQKLGIKMANFRPDQVTLGTQANEKGRRRNEFLRTVKFTRPLAVSRHEISETQFAAFSGVSGAKSGTSNLPVSNISWTEAVLFCNWLSEKEGLLSFYKLSGGRYQGINKQSKGYRLPSEAEWEWLAKRSRRSVGTRYVWGNMNRVPDKAGNFSDESAKDNNPIFLKGYEDGHEGKAPVGSFDPDRIGLFDLAGNVSEWVHDIYTNIPPASTEVLRDSLGPEKGNGHLYKGGSYNTGRIKELRAAWRESSAAKADIIGFRIARYL
jgi:formylglycine-generating enzyme required for sulfatase activity